MMSGERQQNHRALVCFALKQEAQFFTPSPQWRTSANMAITGMGQSNAACVVRQLLANSSPSLVLTCGFAGALNPKLPRGAIVFSTDDGLNLSPALLRFGAKPVRFHCSPRVAVTSAEKQQLWESTRADAVDMESEIIRQLCRERGIPSATIRVISDSAEEDLPLDFNALMTSEQNLRYLRVAAELIRSPGKLSQLLELRRSTTAAARQLGAYLNELLERQFW
jgi:adenosylhomocysteine nucleosidase